MFEMRMHANNPLDYVQCVLHVKIRQEKHTIAFQSELIYILHRALNPMHFEYSTNCALQLNANPSFRPADAYKSSILQITIQHYFYLIYVIKWHSFHWESVEIFINWLIFHSRWQRILAPKNKRFFFLTAEVWFWNFMRLKSVMRCDSLCRVWLTAFFECPAWKSQLCHMHVQFLVHWLYR